MPLSPGTRIGSYEVTGTLGAGGMGEVYRAVDTRLKREVALKILPDSFAADHERLARFQREAEVLASLNHPHIAGIYSIEEGENIRALVLELVEGETLADRLARGPVPVSEALGVAIQIAEAFEAAHDSGIVHRDLKPANVKVRPDGTVKVLDFGLAKLVEASGAGGVARAGGTSGAGRGGPLGPAGDALLSQSPTLTSPAMATGVGVLLGTAAYMSPEQAKGRVADRRSDIWAFGCVLYELLTGKRAFAGEDIPDTLAAVLRGDPDWSALPSDTPRPLIRLIKRCLERDRAERLHDIGDARIDLREIQTAPDDGTTPAAAATVERSVVRRLIPLAATAVLSAAIVGIAGIVGWVYAPTAPAVVSRFNVALGVGEVYTGTGRHLVAISPSGDYIVYGVNNRLDLRRLDQLTAVPIRGTEAAPRSPFISPDGEWIGFWSSGTLMKVGRGGGTPVKICVSDSPMGATWGADNTIVYGQATKGIWRVNGNGGTPEAIITVESGESAHGPQLLPGGEWVLFTLRPNGVAAWDDSLIVAQSIRTGERRTLIQGGRDARYVSTGHLVYARAGTVFGMTFDAGRLQTTGSAVPLLESVPDGGTTTGAVHFAVAENGTLAYVSSFSAGGGTPVWVDRQGRELSAVTAAPLEAVQHPRLSPDGRRLAVAVAGDLWVHDLEGRPAIRLTRDGEHYAPFWTPDGKHLIYETNAPSALLSVPADAVDEKPTAVSPVGHYHPHGFTSDGRELIAVSVDDSTQGTNTDIVAITLGSKPESRPVIRTPAREGFEGVSLSPDGRWLAYVGDTTGQLEVWVHPVDRQGASVRVSPNGGIEPIWAKDGRELFYLQGKTLMAVGITPGPRLDFSPARPLFESRYLIIGQPPSYDVASDGRFLMLKSDGSQRDSAPMVVVLNWLEELKRVVSPP